jgi:hypothetical protein
LFYWVWVPLVQDHLDKFRGYYNSHDVRSQQGKKAPTGVSPNMLDLMPEQYDPEARDCRVKVKPEWVTQERDRLGGMEARAQLLEWYPLFFGDICQDIWESIGRPTLQLNNGWRVFTAISAVMEQPGFWDDKELP